VYTIESIREKEFVVKKSIGAKTSAFPNPAWCIGSYDEYNKPDPMTMVISVAMSAAE